MTIDNPNYDEARTVRTEKVRAEFDFTLGDDYSYIAVDNYVPDDGIMVSVGEYEETLGTVALSPKDAVALAKYILNKYPDAE